MFKNKICSLLVCICVLVFAICYTLPSKVSSVQTVKESEYTTESDCLYLPVMMYHSLLKDKKLQNDYTISPSVFENDLKYFTDNGYTTITVNDLTDFVFHHKELPVKCVMLTFDDGYYNNYYYAYPLLKKYNCKAVISPIVYMTEKFTDTQDISANYGHISTSDIKEMVESGCVEIQNHTYNLHKLSPRRGTEQKRGESDEDYKAALTKDITTAQEYLKEKLDIIPTCFVYPFGAKSKDTEDIVKSLGFVCTLTCTERPNYISRDPQSLYELGRYRRDGKEGIEALMKRIDKDRQKLI